MTTPCQSYAHDYEHAKVVARATWICPKCQQDISLEYLFWHQAMYPTALDPDEDGSTAKSIKEPT